MLGADSGCVIERDTVRCFRASCAAHCRPARTQIAQTYEPNPANRKIYNELFKEFANIYQSNKAMYARLNRAK